MPRSARAETPGPTGSGDALVGGGQGGRDAVVRFDLAGEGGGFGLGGREVRLALGDRDVWRGLGRDLGRGIDRVGRCRRPCRRRRRRRSAASVSWRRLRSAPLPGHRRPASDTGSRPAVGRDRIEWCGRGLGRPTAAMPARSGGSGMVSAIVAMRVGSSSASSSLEERGHLRLECRDGRPDAFDACVDRGGMGLDLAVESGLALRDPRLGLFADAGDLCLRPFADGRDVIVGMTPQRGDLLGRGVVDLLDDGLRVGGEASHRLVARGLGGDLHRAAEIGHELRRATRGGRCGLLDHGGCRCLLSVRGFIGDGGLHGVRHRLVGFGPIRIPRKSETSSGIGLGHRARSSFGTSGGGHT